MKATRIILTIGAVAALVATSVLVYQHRTEITTGHEFGDTIDELNGVKIYYNGATSTTEGRSLSADGYNHGLRYQCVEFVKRYYFERLQHRMPNTWGHAKDFYDPTIADGKINPARGLVQFVNGGSSRPSPEDLIVFGPSAHNQYGHVAIVSSVSEDKIEIAQQNPGINGKSRVTFDLQSNGTNWRVMNDRVLGWLRMPPTTTLGAEPKNLP